MTNATSVGAGLDRGEARRHQPPAASGTGFAGHTGDGGVGDEIVRGYLGAAIGAGAIWTWDDGVGLDVPAGTTNGVALLCPTGTGQILDYYVIWEE